MKTIYFTRHGETVWNVENKICGAVDSPLTDKGRMQARALAERIRSADLGIDEILYSPLSRASETAQIISEQTGMPARKELRLMEQNFGRWEGTPRDGKDFARDKENFINSFGTGESNLRVAQRIYNLLDDIGREEGDQTYLLVAHNGIARMVKSYFDDMTNEEFAKFGIHNCELLKFVYPDRQTRKEESDD
ncbi:MAG: histidine phosphatase family protein [Eubacteriales bacterium]|nr:histidine phosphatase family protein [Eubacteriales bacterium]